MNRSDNDILLPDRDQGREAATSSASSPRTTVWPGAFRFADGCAGCPLRGSAGCRQRTNGEARQRDTDDRAGLPQLRLIALDGELV